MSGTALRVADRIESRLVPVQMWVAAQTDARSEWVEAERKKAAETA